jgi:hypothetical protein
MKRIEQALLISIIICILSVPGHLCAGTGDAGSAGAYLRMGVGARPLGMGGTFTAMANDVYATYWNPAGLTQLRSHEIGSMYTLMSLDRKHNSICYAVPFGGAWALGVGWINFGVDKIERRTGNTIDPEGTFDDAENAYSLSIAKSVMEALAFGGNFKFLTHKLADKSATGFGFDLGLLFKPKNFLSFGLNIQDIASGLKWNTDPEHKDKFPLNIRGGAVLKLLNERLLVGIEPEKNLNQSMKLHGGAEYWLVEVFAARAGYDDEEFTAGASFKISNFQLDYAFSTDKLDEGSSHRISLLIKLAGK